MSQWHPLFVKGEKQAGLFCQYFQERVKKSCLRKKRKISDKLKYFYKEWSKYIHAAITLPKTSTADEPIFG